MCSSLTCHSLPTKAQIKPYVCFTISESVITRFCRFSPPEEPTVWPKPALQSNTKYNCMGIQEGEGASTPAIHCRHSPWLQTWDKLRIWARELLLTFLQHSGKHFVNPFMRHPSTPHTAPSPLATGTCNPALLAVLKALLFPVLLSKVQWAKQSPADSAGSPGVNAATDKWASSMTALGEWRIPAYRTTDRSQSTTETPVRVFNKIWHDTHAISHTSPVCGPHFLGHISLSCWVDKHLSISPVSPVYIPLVFPMPPVGYTRPVPALLYYLPFPSNIYFSC